MSNVKYVGLDVHKASTVIVGLDALGQLESPSKVKTKAENSGDCLRGLRGQVAVVFEEGPHAAGLQQRLKPLVAAGTVGDPRHNQLRCGSCALSAAQARASLHPNVQSRESLGTR